MSLKCCNSVKQLDDNLVSLSYYACYRPVIRAIGHPKMDDAPSTTVKVYLIQYCMFIDYCVYYRPTADQLLAHSSLHKVCVCLSVLSDSRNGSPILLNFWCTSLVDINSTELLSSLSQNSKYTVVIAQCDVDGYRQLSCHAGVVQCGVD